MAVHFVSPDTFEPWDHRNPDTQGIGGSETAMIECAHRLARRGYPVYCYAPVPDDCPREWRGTHWRHWREADVTAPGVWIVSRWPAFLDRLQGPPHQRIWLVAQDMRYDDPAAGLTPERGAKLERLVALCRTQERGFRERHPYLAQKLCVSTNGVKLDLIREVEAENLPRDPHRLFYGSSPDRGLLPLLKIFRRAREWVPDLTLEVAYGWDNIDKVIARAGGSHPSKLFRDEVMKAADQPGVTWLGRLPQREVLRHIFRAGMWCYPFTARVESSCVACMEAQACGAVPIVSPLDAVGENVFHGSFVDGDPETPEVRVRFVQELRRWADPDLQAEIRPQLMEEARRRFNWERVIDQYEHWLAGGAGSYPVAQYAFQHHHAAGRVLNVGCAEDSSGLAAKGALNLDITDRHPDGRDNAAHLLADARDLPACLHGRFDAVVLGDILEHFTPEDRRKALAGARACLTPAGRVVVTWPVDGRPAAEQGVSGEYAPGLPVPHPGPVSLEAMRADWEAAGLRAAVVQPLDYTFATGYGVVLQ